MANCLRCGKPTSTRTGDTTTGLCADCQLAQQQEKQAKELAERQRLKEGPFGFWVLMTGSLIILFWSVYEGSPIPSGREDRNKAEGFIATAFPGRTVLPKSDAAAPVAVVFYLIRRGESADAIRALEFAAAQRFGYASPYAIERLQSDDIAVRRAAREFLQTIAARDYGRDPQAWRRWWHDPPRRFFGLTVGQRTLELAQPVLLFLWGLLWWWLGHWRHKERFPPQMVMGLLGLTLFYAFIVVVCRYFPGGLDSCTFDGEEISYYSAHGIVLGLEDAQPFSGGLIALGSAGLAVVVVLVLRVLGKGFGARGKAVRE
jgi:hypothetical protein